MRRIVVFSFLIAMIWETQGFALPKGSPNRCIETEWNGNHFFKWNENSLLPPPSQYENSPAFYYEEKFKKVTPQEITQSVLDLMLTYYDNCGTPPAGAGSLEEFFGIRICEQLALYDMTHDSIFSNETSTDHKEASLFSPDDLSFLKSVFKACRPSMRKAWWYPLIFHVSFEPTPEEYKQFWKILESDFMYQKVGL